MTDRYILTVTLHVLAAVVWLGGMLFFAIAAPVMRRVEDDDLRAKLFDALGRRFRLVGWICVAILLASGIEQLRMRGWWGTSFWGQEGLLRTSLGVSLTWKLSLVAVMVAVQAFHDFWWGPRAGLARPGTPEARALRVNAARLARLNAFVGLLLLYFAVRVARGG